MLHVISKHSEKPMHVLHPVSEFLNVDPPPPPFLFISTKQTIQYGVFIHLVTFFSHSFLDKVALVSFHSVMFLIDTE